MRVRVSVCTVRMRSTLPHAWELRHHTAPVMWLGDHICGCGCSGKLASWGKEVSLSKPAVWACEETHNCLCHLFFLCGHKSPFSGYGMYKKFCA